MNVKFRHIPLQRAIIEIKGIIHQQFEDYESLNRGFDQSRCGALYNAIKSNARGLTIEINPWPGSVIPRRMSRK